MKFIQDTILVMASQPVRDAIETSLHGIPGLSMTETDNEKKAFELIYTHNFVLIIAEDNLDWLNLYSLGAMLMSHKKIHNAPLLIIKNTFDENSFLSDFAKLHIDYMSTPFPENLIQAKIKIFYDLHQMKTAVDQSLEELDNAYNQMIIQNDSIMEESLLKRKPETSLRLAANQIESPLQSLLSDVYQLLRDKNLPEKSKSTLLNLKTCSQRVAQIAKLYLHVPGRSVKVNSTNQAAQDFESAVSILYADPSIEDFSLFNHFLKNKLSCALTHAPTIEECLELLVRKQFNVIFIAHHFPDGEGLRLFSRLKRIQPYTPVIFIINREYSQDRPQIISKGAFACFIKEELSSAPLVDTILNSFEKARILKAAEDARDRIVLISQKDSMTKLLNRHSFETKLTQEMTAAKRYNTKLSLVMLHFNIPGSPSPGHEQNAGDLLLISSAALIQSIIRDTDIICRYDKNRFAVLLPHTGLNGTKILANRIKDKISTHYEAVVKPSENPSYVRTGVSGYDPDTPLPASKSDDLIKDAIENLG